MTWLSRRSLSLATIGALTLTAACANNDGSPALVDDDASATSGPTPGSTSTVGTTGAASSSESSSGFELVCLPGEERCTAEGHRELCAPTGASWNLLECTAETTCYVCTDSDDCTGTECQGPCNVADELPSSAGCTFISSRQAHMNPDVPDGLIIANPNSELTATVQLSLVPLGESTPEPVGDPVLLAPGETTTFDVEIDFVQGNQSNYRTGDIVQVDSDVPIVAYQHAPLTTITGNDSSMLLPVGALGKDYVVFSYPARTNLAPGAPSYFEVIAVEDDTVINWTPLLSATSGSGLPVNRVEAGEEGELRLNRYDTVRISASTVTVDGEPIEADLVDVSGTVLRSNAPIWVVSGTRCARVPIGEDDPEFAGCDPLQEQVLPLEYWGETYVGIHSPVRENERHHWRVFAGKDGVRVTTDPPQPGTPHTFAKRGDFIEFEVPNGTSFVLEGDGAFMPVQYMQSAYVPSFVDQIAEKGTSQGDPSMYQMVPTEQFLSRYAFTTPSGFDSNFVQVVRQIDGPEIRTDGEMVTGYYPVAGRFEIADVSIEPGPHLIESAAPFGIIQAGFADSTPNRECGTDGELGSCFTSYGYPGGMKSEAIFIP